MPSFDTEICSMMPDLTIFLHANRFVKDVLNPSVKLEPWMHVGTIELDNGNLGYAIELWDSRQVIEEGELSDKQSCEIRFYITDQFMTNENRVADSYLPLVGGGDISKAISKYFNEQYDDFVDCVETVMHLPNKSIGAKSKESAIAKRAERIISLSTHELQCFDIDSSTDGVQIRCNGGHETAKMINRKLKKAGLKTDLPKGSRIITVYGE